MIEMTEEEAIQFRKTIEYVVYINHIRHLRWFGPYEELNKYVERLNKCAEDPEYFFRQTPQIQKEILFDCAYVSNWNDNKEDKKFVLEIAKQYP